MSETGVGAAAGSGWFDEDEAHRASDLEKGQADACLPALGGLRKAQA